MIFAFQLGSKGVWKAAFHSSHILEGERTEDSIPKMQYSNEEQSKMHSKLEGLIDTLMKFVTFQNQNYKWRQQCGGEIYTAVVTCQRLSVDRSEGYSPEVGGQGGTEAC